MVWTCNAKLLLGLLVIVALTAGCGPQESFERAAVNGKVELDGKPLAQGVVRFVPAGGTQGPKTSVPVLDGVFEADTKYGPPLGSHRVEIESTDRGGLEMDDEDAIQKLAKSGKRRIRVVRVPTWYNRSSMLRADVHEGENKFDFQLSSKRKR